MVICTPDRQVVHMINEEYVDLMDTEYTPYINGSSMCNVEQAFHKLTVIILIFTTLNIFNIKIKIRKYVIALNIKPIWRQNRWSFLVTNRRLTGQ
jgi:hypothetical protein